MSQPQRKMSPQDESLWFKIRVALKVDPSTESLRDFIKMQVNRGQVTLEGAVPSAEALHNVQRVVLSVTDVVGIDNRLTVAG